MRHSLYKPHKLSLLNDFLPPISFKTTPFSTTLSLTKFSLRVMLQFIVILSLWNSKGREVIKYSITKYKSITNNFSLSGMPNRIKIQVDQFIANNSTTEAYKNVSKNTKRMSQFIALERILKTWEVRRSTNRYNNKQVLAFLRTKMVKIANNSINKKTKS